MSVSEDDKRGQTWSDILSPGPGVCPQHYLLSETQLKNCVGMRISISPGDGTDILFFIDFMFYLSGGKTLSPIDVFVTKLQSKMKLSTFVPVIWLDPWSGIIK